MSRLSQMRGSTGRSHNTQSDTSEFGITSIAPFQRPISAKTLDNDENVRVLATGDIEGMSPAYLCVNDKGQSDWVSLNDVKITDEQVVPLSQHQRDELQQSGYARTGR